MKKFEQKETCPGLLIETKHSNSLFGIQYALWIKKYYNCYQCEAKEDNNRFDFHGLEKVFIGNARGDTYMMFQVVKILVIEIH